MTRGIFVASNALPAADLNDCFDPPRAFVRNSANISIAVSGTAQALTFDTEVEDTGAMHSTVSQTERLTVPTGGQGFYLIGGNALFAANATGARTLTIRLNGATELAKQIMLPGAATAVALQVSVGYPLAAGDYVELLATQTSGGALNVTAGANFSPSFWCIWQAVA